MEKESATHQMKQDEADIPFGELSSTGEYILAEPDWTAAEERAAKRKIDFILLPILGLAFFALQMDRGNIGNALTDTITEDLHVTTNQINIGTQLLSAGIVLLEIPSNVILQKTTPTTTNAEAHNVS
ncbi:MAG: hypothetical protein M1818_008484 [Claussenomyces sp. TS43310]|nr:MAG: hypothetical protein M1818_008484 [Claussenomyces sp. TS43310]